MPACIDDDRRIDEIYAQHGGQPLERVHDERDRYFTAELIA
jgi:hypothetical protein